MRSAWNRADPSTRTAGQATLWTPLMRRRWLWDGAQQHSFKKPCTCWLQVARGILLDCSCHQRLLGKTCSLWCMLMDALRGKTIKEAVQSQHCPCTLTYLRTTYPKTRPAATWQAQAEQNNPWIFYDYAAQTVHWNTLTIATAWSVITGPRVSAERVQTQSLRTWVQVWTPPVEMVETQTNCLISQALHLHQEEWNWDHRVTELLQWWREINIYF